jgi:hypothetical protein
MLDDRRIWIRIHTYVDPEHCLKCITGASSNRCEFYMNEIDMTKRDEEKK